MVSCAHDVMLEQDWQEPGMYVLWWWHACMMSWLAGARWMYMHVTSTIISRTISSSLFTLTWLFTCENVNFHAHMTLRAHMTLHCHMTLHAHMLTLSLFMCIHVHHIWLSYQVNVLNHIWPFVYHSTKSMYWITFDHAQLTSLSRGWKVLSNRNRPAHKDSDLAREHSRHRWIYVVSVE
jgi:hypothetical protein